MRRLKEDGKSAVAILHSGRVDDDVQRQAERVDQDMPFAAGDLLAPHQSPAGQAWSPLLSRFGALTVDDRGGSAGFTALALARGDGAATF